MGYNQRYWKVITRKERKSYWMSITLEAEGWAIPYPENSVVWCRPGTIGIFVFDNPYDAYCRSGVDHNAMVVEVFPLGWQVRPKKVLWADYLYHYVSIEKCRKNIYDIVKLFQNPINFPSHFQDLWPGTLCCEGVLVGKEIEREELSRLIDHYRRAV